MAVPEYPSTTFSPRNWRNRKQLYSLVGEVCPHCETKSLAPRNCCGGESQNQFSSRGEAFSGDTTYSPPESVNSDQPIVVIMPFRDPAPVS